MKIFTTKLAFLAGFPQMLTQNS